MSSTVNATEAGKNLYEVLNAGDSESVSSIVNIIAPIIKKRMSEIVSILAKSSSDPQTKEKLLQKGEEIMDETISSLLKPLMQKTAASVFGDDVEVNEETVRKCINYAKKGIKTLIENVKSNPGWFSDFITNTKDVADYILDNCVNVDWLMIGANASTYMFQKQQFSEINKKLDQLQLSIDKIESRVQIIESQMKEMAIYRPVREMINKSDYLLKSIERGTRFEKKELVDVIMLFSNTIPGLVFNDGKKTDGKQETKEQNKAIEMDQILELLYELLPLMTKLTVMYYEDYYKESGRLTGVDKVFEIVSGEELRARIQEYYLIQKGYHNNEVNQILNSHFLINANLMMQMEEVIQLNELCKTPEQYIALRGKMDEAIASACKDFSALLRTEMNQEEANKCISDALKAVLQKPVSAA